MEFKKNWRNSLTPESRAIRMNTNLNHREAAKLDGVSEVSMRDWRKKHLTKAEYLKCGSRLKPVWEQWQEVIANNTELTNHEVSFNIGRSVEAVRKWRQRYLTDVQKEELLKLKGFNIKSKHKYKQDTRHKGKEVTTRILRVMIEYWHLPTRDLAQLLGRSEKSISYIKSQMKELKESLNGIKDL